MQTHLLLGAVQSLRGISSCWLVWEMDLGTSPLDRKAALMIPAGRRSVKEFFSGQAYVYTLIP
jgi:hypothetical protein